MAEEHHGSYGVNEQQYAQAKVAGESARRAGRKREACPQYGTTDDAKILREAWMDAWDEEDARRRK